MDVIESELKRYELMQTDFENFKRSFDNLNSDAKDQSKSYDDLDTLMNEEKPKDVNINLEQQIFPGNHTILMIKLFKFFLDGTTTSANSRIKAASKVWKLVKSIDEHDVVIASKPYT